MTMFRVQLRAQTQHIPCSLLRQTKNKTMQSLLVNYFKGCVLTHYLNQNSVYTCMHQAPMIQSTFSQGKSQLKSHMDMKIAQK